MTLTVKILKLLDIPRDSRTPDQRAKLDALLRKRKVVWDRVREAAEDQGGM